MGFLYKWYGAVLTACRQAFERAISANQCQLGEIYSVGHLDLMATAAI